MISLLASPTLRAILGGALVLALLVGAGWWLHSSGYQSGKDDCESAHKTVELEAFRAETTKLSGISNQLEQASSDLAQAKPVTIKEYHRETIKQVLPAGCVLDAGRLRPIQSAIGTPATSK